MAFIEAGTFAFTTIAATEFKPAQASVQRDVKFVDTTGSGDTTVQLTQSGLRHYRGQVTGWLQTNGPGYDQDTDTVTMTVTNGMNTTATVVLDKINSTHDYGSMNRKLVPVVYNYRFYGTINIDV